MIKKTPEEMMLEVVWPKYSHKLNDLKEVNRMRLSFLHLITVVLSLIIVEIKLF